MGGRGTWSIAMLTAATSTKRRWETSWTPRSARFSEVYWEAQANSVSVNPHVAKRDREREMAKYNAETRGLPRGTSC